MTSGPSEIFVEESIVVPASPQRAWNAIVDAPHRAHWWSYLDMDPTRDGRFEEHWTGSTGEPRLTSGRVTELIEPTRLSLTWADDDWPAATRVEIELHVIDDFSTSVGVRHLGWERLPEGDRLANEHREGWRAHLRHLRDYLSA